MDSTNFLCFAYGRGSSFNALPYTVNIISNNFEKLIDLNKIPAFATYTQAEINAIKLPDTWFNSQGQKATLPIGLLNYFG